MIYPLLIMLFIDGQINTAYTLYWFKTQVIYQKQLCQM